MAERLATDSRVALHARAAARARLAPLLDRLAPRLLRLGVRAAGKRALPEVISVLREVAPSDIRHRKVLQRLQVPHEFDEKVAQARLRELGVGAVFEGADELELPLGMIHEESGLDNHAEFLYLLAAMKALRPRRILEFGTLLGQTTYYLARALPDARIVTVDLPADQLAQERDPYIGFRYAGTPEADRIEEIRVNSRRFDVGDLRGTMDAVWIDGDHSYEGVRNDTEKAFEALGPGGAIFWHDFAPKTMGIVDFIVELTRERPLFWIRRTSIVFHLDGVDPLTFQPRRTPFDAPLEAWSNAT